MSKIYDAVYHYIRNAYYEHYTLAHELPYFVCEAGVNQIHLAVKNALPLGELMVMHAKAGTYIIALLELRA